MSDNYAKCPECGGTDFRSVETASIGYAVTVSASGEVNYTGEDYTVFDEGTQFEDVLYCRDCGWYGGMAALNAVGQVSS